MGRDDRPVRRAGPADDLGAARRPAGQAARRRTAAARHRLGDGTGLLPRARCARWPATSADEVGAGIAALVRQQFIRPRTIRSARDRGDGVPSPAHPRRRLRRDPEGHARRAARTVRRLAGRVPADRSASRTRSSATTSSRRTATGSSWERPANASGSWLTRPVGASRPRASGRPRAATSPRIDQPPLSGLRVARSRRPTAARHAAGPRVCARLGRRHGWRRGHLRRSDRASAPPRATSRCVCTPSSKRWLARSEADDFEDARREAERALGRVRSTREMNAASPGPGSSSQRCTSPRGSSANAERSWSAPWSTRATRGTSASRPRSTARLGAHPVAGAPRRSGRRSGDARRSSRRRRGTGRSPGLMYHPMAHMKARQGEFEEALDLASRCRDIHRENGAMWSYWVFAEIEWDIKMLAGRAGRGGGDPDRELRARRADGRASRSNPRGWRSPSTRSAGSTRPNGGRRRPSTRWTTFRGVAGWVRSRGCGRSRDASTRRNGWRGRPSRTSREPTTRPTAPAS